MAQNIYDDPDFFNGYAQLDRSRYGLNGAPEWPTVRALLPELRDKQVVDLGCGYGWFCRYAREQGAAQVLGIDLSQKMLQQAQSMTYDNAITYRQQDLETLRLPAARFDLAYSALALHYIVDADALLNTVYQALIPGGQFIFTAEHPIYTAPLSQQWLTDADGRKSWPVNHYQQEGERVSNWLAEGVIKQHRKLASWINLLVKNGFIVRHMDEWGPSAPQIAANPALEEESERPMFFILAAQKAVDR